MFPKRRLVARRGRFLGQDPRRHVFDGAPSDHLCAVDILSYWDVCYRMFCDDTRFSAHFIKGNILCRDEALTA